MFLGILSMVFTLFHPFLGAIISVFGIVSGNRASDIDGKKDGLKCAVVALILAIFLSLMYNTFYHFDLSPGIDLMVDFLELASNE